MAAPSVTYTFSNSTTADATQVNQNFTDLINGASDGTKDYSINALTCAGAATLNGNVTLGNSSSDDVTITGSLASSVAIKTTYSYDIGSATLGLRSIYLGSSDSAARGTRLIGATVASNYTFTLPTSGGTANYVMKTNGSGTTSWENRTVLSVVYKSTTYTAAIADDVILCTTSGGGWTLTLPDATASAGKTFRVQKVSSDTSALTITRAGSDLINGGTSTTLDTQWEAVEFTAYGTDWYLRRLIPSAWTTWTPTGTWSTNTTYTGAYSRQGDGIRFWVKIALAGAPTSATLTVNTPFTANTTGTPTGTVVGVCQIKSAGTIQVGVTELNASTTIRPLTSTGSIVNATTPGTFASGDYLYFEGFMAVSGWKG